MMTRVTVLALALLLLLHIGVVSSQPDPDLVAPDPTKTEDIDLPGCFADLAAADADENGFIEQREYLGFIQLYAKNRLCLDEWPELTLQQAGTFNTLACLCQSLGGQPNDCCIAAAARIPTAGAPNHNNRTEAELQYLTITCEVTHGTLPMSECPSSAQVTVRPPPPLVAPTTQPAVAPRPTSSVLDMFPTPAPADVVPTLAPAPSTEAPAPSQPLTTAMAEPTVKPPTTEQPTNTSSSASESIQRLVFRFLVQIFWMAWVGM